MVGCLEGRLDGWLAGGWVCQLVGWLIGWLVGWWVGCLGGQWVGWLVGGGGLVQKNIKVFPTKVVKAYRGSRGIAPL